jgi:tetratricopeptide (TPR) repeat protein
MFHRFPRVLVSVVALLVLSRPCGIALAQAPAAERSGEATAHDHYRKGMSFYDLGRFDDAIREFEAAYQYQEDPFYIFNLAQAYRRAGNGAKALELYRTYLRKVPNAPDRADVEQRIANLEKSLRSAPPAPVSPPPSPAAAPAAVASAPSSLPLPGAGSSASLPAGGVHEADRPPAPVRRSNLAFTGGVATAVAGLALVGTGAFFGIRAKQKFDEALGDGARYDPSLDDSARRAQTLEYVFLGVGAAAIATGGVLVVLGLQDDGPRRRTALVPLVDGQGVRLTFAGVF